MKFQLQLPTQTPSLLFELCLSRPLVPHLDAQGLGGAGLRIDSCPSVNSVNMSL